MPLNRAFEPMTIKKFKGMNTALVGSTPEQYSADEEELSDLTNFNTTTDGFLEKRSGVTELCRIISPAVPASVRVIYLQRSRLGTGTNRLFVTDGTNVWRVEVPAGTITRITNGGGGTIAGLQWMIEYGGTAPATSYQCYGVRWTATSNPRALGGIQGFYADNTVDQPAFYPNSPIGTQFVLFKNRGWVINSRGAENLAGDETKVWFSDPTSMPTWGGAGLPNNINFDFGDGDFLVSMVPFFDQLYLFKTKKTYVLSADGSPTNWQYRLVSDRLGCVGRGTVKLYNGVVYFLSLEGVVRTDGTTFQVISTPIREYLDVYRNYLNPLTTMDIYASIWDNKYILWMPDSGGTNATTALVFNLHTESWTKWKFSNFISVNGEAVWDEHYPDTLFFGSGAGSIATNRVWQMGLGTVWTDNGSGFDCTFTTKKYDLGKIMGRKRNHLVGLSVVDNSNNQGTYAVQTTSDDTTVVSNTQAPARLSAMNLKGKGAGYCRYLQTKVTQNSTAYAAVYDITWMNEERGFEQKSIPVKNA